MRYTTIIDVSEMAWYNTNVNARLVYLHLALRAGYHEDNQDLVYTSLRRLAMELHLSVSATRYALATLRASGLVTPEGKALRVAKFVQPIIAAKRAAKQLVATTKEAESLGEAKRRIQDELSKLRRWYKDAQQRGDNASMEQIKVEAARYQKQLATM